MVGDEDDYQETKENSTQDASIQTINNPPPGWKSRLWKTAKKLGITALVATGGYQTGYYRGVNSKTIDQVGSQFNNSVNSNQIVPPSHPFSAINSPLETLNPKNFNVLQDDNNPIIFVPNDSPSLDNNSINKTETENQKGQLNKKELTDDKSNELNSQETKGESDKEKNPVPLNSTKDIENLENKLNATQADSTKWKDYLNTALQIIAEKDAKLGSLTTKLDNQELSLCQKRAELNATQAALKEEIQRKENFNQQLDEAQQELVRTQREKRKLVRKLNRQKTQKAKTQTHFQEQNNYLQSILKCLASAGIGYLKNWKPNQTLSETDIQNLEQGINKLIEQRSQAWKEKDYWENKNKTDHKSNENSTPPCSCSDIQRNKKEIIYQDNEQTIIQELNDALKLNLQSPTLKQVISKIQWLINKDPIIETINTPFGEDFKCIKELEISSLEKLFPNFQLEVNFINQIKQANNYRQLTEIRNEFLSKYLKLTQREEIGEKQLVKNNNIERYVWISLLALSLTSLGIIWIKLINKKKKIKNT